MFQTSGNPIFSRFDMILSHYCSIMTSNVFGISYLLLFVSSKHDLIWSIKIISSDCRHLLVHSWFASPRLQWSWHVFPLSRRCWFRWVLFRYPDNILHMHNILHIAVLNHPTQTSTVVDLIFCFLIIIKCTCAHILMKCTYAYILKKCTCTHIFV